MASGCCSPLMVTRFEFRGRDISDLVPQLEQAAGVEPTSPRACGALRLGHRRAIGAAAVGYAAGQPRQTGMLLGRQRRAFSPCRHDPSMLGPSHGSRDVAGCREPRSPSLRAAPRGGT